MTTPPSTGRRLAYLEQPATAPVAHGGGADVNAVTTDDGGPTPTYTPTSRTRRWVRRHSLGAIGIVLIVIIAACAIVGPLLRAIDPNEIDLLNRLAPPGSDIDGQTAWLGTDSLGRDVLARAFVGGRVSLIVVVFAVLLSTVLGTVLGLVSGFWGGWVDTAIMRLVDAQLALPVLILAMLVGAVLGNGLMNTAMTLAVASWPVYARLIRGEVLKIREEEYMESAIAMGSRDLRIIYRHVLPNVTSSLLVISSLQLGQMVLWESSLSYIGFGLQPPDASWGSMIRQGQDHIQSAWWLSAVPGIFISLTVLGLNLVGDWLRDVFDPHRT